MYSQIIAMNVRAIITNIVIVKQNIADFAERNWNGIKYWRKLNGNFTRLWNDY